MFNKARLLRCILASLLVCIIAMLSVGDAAQNNYEKPERRLQAFKTASKNSSLSSVSYRKTVVKNDHIKVRYMGGDCRHGSSFLIEFVRRDFGKGAPVFEHNSYIFSPFDLLFKLRGPPGKTAMT